jgi:ligand-binding sensor domain-containing protein
LSGSVEVPGEEVNVLVVDHQDHVWVGTNSGLGVIVPEGDQARDVMTPSFMGQMNVAALAVDQENNIWMGIDRGVGMISAEGQWALYDVETIDMDPDGIQSMVVDDEGRVWVVDGNTLNRLDPDGQWTTYHEEYGGLPDIHGDLEDLVIASDGRIMIVSEYDLYSFDTEASTSVQVLKALQYGIRISTVLRSLGLGGILILAIVTVFQWRQERLKELAQEQKDIDANDPQMLLDEGKRLLSQGDRDGAIEVYRRAYREGSPTVRDLALKALEELGALEHF